MPKRSDETPLQTFSSRYRVIEQLGEGGIATVYKVHDTRDGTIKALKALKHGGDRNSPSVRRFEEEYRILDALHHPGLPEVFDFGVSGDETRYLVMEYIRGEGLGSFVAAQPGHLWKVLYQLAETLAFIHEHGLLHLDLKPANILVREVLTPSNERTPLLALIDFGVSYRRERGGQVARVGTPAYMAPEIIRGDTEITRAADYYSLGIMLYELTHRRLPFTGTSDQVISAHLTQEIVCDDDMVESREINASIRGLASLDPRRRLQAFEDFRRGLGARVANEVDDFDGMCGMGYLNSMGMIGKKDLSTNLKQWIRLIGGPAEAPTSVSHEPFAARVSTDLARENDPLRTTVRLDERGAGVVHRRDPTPRRAPETDQRSTPAARTVIVSGARGSGKTHVLKAVRAELLIRGIHVVDISDELDYEELVGPASIQTAEEDGEGIDPGSLIIDRFVRGWEQLVARSGPVGVVVVADGVENSSKEVVEFFSYVCKRLDHELEEDVASKIYLLITGRSPHLKRDLDGLLPHGQTDEYMIPPPRSPDIEAVLSMFYGHMSGTGEREMLRQHLVKSAETTDLLLSRLKTAFVRGHLVRSAGKWSFSLSDADARASVDNEPSYYQVLFGQLPSDERTLIAALCTHIDPLSLVDLKAISGLTETRIVKALDRLSPYRVVERIHDAEADVVGLASESLREAFYRGVGEEERRKYHRAYVDYYRAAAVAPLQRHRLLAFHYERSGMVREALVCKISALREMRPRRDLFETREVCSKTIDAVEQLHSREWRSRRWHLKRYFVKRWMEAEWEGNNYAAIVDIVETHILGDRKLVPLSLCYRYGTALEKLGNLQACRRLIKSARRRAAAVPLSTICELSVLEASYYFARGDYVAALKTLDLMEPALESAAKSLMARAFVLYMLCYEGVGNRTGYERFLSKAKEAALAAGDSDQLLAINYSTIMSHLNSSIYEKARSQLKESIRMAHRRRAYDKLSSMYFLASAVYYEEGRYGRALRYLDKAVRVGVNMNMTQRVTDYMLRYAFIYQNMGQYGNAIRFAETARKRAAEANHDGQYFFALLILFDLHNSTSQSKASSFVGELKQLATSVKAKYQIALFHRLLGEFSLAQSLEDDAIHEFQTASRMYQSIGYDDDAARCQMRIAMVYTRRGDRKRSQQILRQVDERVYTMESQDLIAESYLAHLDHYRVFGYKRHMFIGMLKLCDDIRPKISDVNVALRMDALLHKCYSHVGNGEKQTHYLRSYHAIVRDIVSGLHDSDMIAQFLANEEVSAMLARYRALESKKPERVPV